MKKIACFFLATLLCAQPQAEAAGRYWGGKLVYSSFDINSQSVFIEPDSLYDAQVHDMPGGDFRAYGFGMITGLDFGWAGNIPIRLELDTTFSKGGHTRFDGYFLTSGLVPIVTFKSDLYLEFIASESLNIWLDIPVGEFPVKPYVGAGLTLSVIFYEAQTVMNELSPLSREEKETGADFHWDYMLGGGLRYAVGKRTFLDFNVRRVIGDTSFKIWIEPGELRFKTNRTEASLGLVYYF